MGVILFQYLNWYLWDVPKEILQAWRNFLVFNLKYFSVLILLRTFFSHWHKYYYPYGKKWDPWRFFEAIVFNTMSRVIGAMIRAVLIALGLLLEVPIVLIGPVMLIGWFMLPLLLLAGLFVGLRLLF